MAPSEKWDRPLIRTGKILRVLFWIVVICAVWSFKPDDIGDVPFAQLTLKKVFGTLGWGGGIVACGYALFNPSSEADDDYWLEWGKYGTVWIVLAPIALLFLRSCSS
jgi:hypothetical protein